MRDARNAGPARPSRRSRTAVLALAAFVAFALVAAAILARRRARADAAAGGPPGVGAPAIALPAASSGPDHGDATASPDSLFTTARENLSAARGDARRREIDRAIDAGGGRARTVRGVVGYDSLLVRDPGGGTLRIDALESGPRGTLLREFYYDDGTSFLVAERIFAGPAPAGIAVEEQRYYLDRGALLRWVDAAGNARRFATANERAMYARLIAGEAERVLGRAERAVH